MKQKKVLVLEGGFNEEHEISISTGKEVQKSLKKLGIEHKILSVNNKTFIDDIDNFDRDFVCFNALHGTFGEDGTIQKILDQKGFKYTHSNALSSHIGFNKDLTKKEMNETLLVMPRHLNVNFRDLNEKLLKNILSNFGEFIIKPNCSGSSFGIFVIKNIKDIENFINDFDNNLEIYKNHNSVLVEEFINGRELTVAVIEKNNDSVAVEVTEILSDNDKYFDYNSKYTPGLSEHILPANLNKSIYDKCKMFAKIAHDKINCKALSRSDFIILGDEIFFLEINTQPGLTPVSLVPEQLNFQNISFDDLIVNILKCAQ